jgi:hypothetical protein
MPTTLLRHLIWNRGLVFGAPAAACYIFAAWCFISGGMLVGLALIGGSVVGASVLMWCTDRLAPRVGLSLQALHDFERPGPRAWWTAP